MIAVVGIMCSYLLTYTPERPNGPSDTVVHYDENNNPVVMVPQEDENFNFLVLGRDRIANLTDVIMLINYNVTDGSIAITQFPRDTYVGYGVATSKINATYPTFYNQAVGSGSKQPELDALRRFADTPIFTLVDGVSQVVKKVRGDKAVVTAFVNHVKTRMTPGTKYYVGVTNPAYREEYAQALEKAIGYPPEMIIHLGSAVCSNTGPDCAAALFEGPKRER